MENILDRTKGLLENKRKCEWALPQLTQQLLRLKRPRLNEVLQVLTGHGKLQKLKNTIAHDVPSTCPCPKCNEYYRTNAGIVGRQCRQCRQTVQAL